MGYSSLPPQERARITRARGLVRRQPGRIVLSGSQSNMTHITPINADKNLKIFLAGDLAYDAHRAGNSPSHLKGIEYFGKRSLQHLLLIIAGTILFLFTLYQSPPAQAEPLEARKPLDSGQRLISTEENSVRLTEMRIAALKADLRLTPEQTNLWPAVESALRDQAMAFRARQGDLRSLTKERGARGDPVEWLKTDAQYLTQCAAERESLLAVLSPFYESLGKEQKLRFTPRFKLVAGSRCY